MRAMKASRIMAMDEASFLSQFFRSRRHFSVSALKSTPSYAVRNSDRGSSASDAERIGGKRFAEYHHIRWLDMP
jgi:hypothetical protein